MINTQMAKYNYSLLGVANEYGELDINSTVVGSVEMAINLFSQNTADNVLYSTCEYIGLTKEVIDDNYIIHYGNEKLKVMYVNSFGRLKQVYMQRM